MDLALDRDICKALTLSDFLTLWHKDRKKVEQNVKYRMESKAKCNDNYPFLHLAFIYAFAPLF